MDVKGLALITDGLLAACHQSPGGSGKRELADGLVHSPSAKPSALPLPPGRDKAMHVVGSVILSRGAAARLVSAMKQPPIIAVILSAAKDLAIGWIATVALGADSLFAGQMLHFVQHDMVSA